MVDVHNQIEKFWLIEKLPSESRLSKEDEECERLFCSTTKRSQDGKFVVRMPLSQPVSKLGDSKQIALNRFLSLEKRLIKDLNLHQMYRSFIQEYIDLGHMSLLDIPGNEISYFLPHHGVLNESKETTKLRVVFSGSSKTNSGVSLNDIQYTGPNLQDNLLSILIRFRQSSIVVCADVEKMFRMIWIDEVQRTLQKILWRSSPEEEIEEYTLNTVTYGTKSAPYLAVRCLRHLGLEQQDAYPEAAWVILNSFYMDDMLFGTDSRHDAIRICREVSNILQSGGMNLRKWISNDNEVMNSIIESTSSSDAVIFGDKDQNKTLGLYWHFVSDVLKFSISFPFRKNHTKRSILSDVSKIFDPLGLLGPCIILAKILLQTMWCEKVAWDETLPLSLDSQWKKLRNEFARLNELAICRHVLLLDPTRIDIVGFSDASSKAYGAVVYLRSFDANGCIRTSLLCSKSKVAPLKCLTIPRLELCGALLLVKLIERVKNAITLKIHNIYLWSDSMVVLGWLRLTPNSLQTFVANRVSQIQSLSEGCLWGHVRSEDNPADFLSRGVYPNDLMRCKKWFEGPDWLKLRESDWCVNDTVEDSSLPEVKVKTCLLISNENNFPFENFSSLIRMKRVMAWCLRFIYNLKNTNIRLSGYIQSDELERAMRFLIFISQRECFGTEIPELQNGKILSNKNLWKLIPFLDENGFIRVGGRLQLSNLDYGKKHPFLMSAKHRLTYLLIIWEHERLLHAGPQLLLSTIREKFWIPGGRNLCRKITHRCVKCFRTAPTPLSQKMGILPEIRVQPAPPFHTTGIDYAGPFKIKDRPGRGAKISKCYIALFICCSVKAIHLELVSDLTTESFIACFRRFASRRVKPALVLSDNGSNFIGANSELRELGEFLRNQSDLLASNMENEGISWKFIPPNAPNFGGLWEAGVRSCKFHLKRIMADASLTFEHFNTLLTQIEATLNSRPIVSLSSSPNDMDVLTPAHFLIGRRLISLPDPDVTQVPVNRLSKFQHIQMLYQHFWKRWSLEYLGELQQRYKWAIESPDVQIGQLVLIKDRNLPPLQWLLGRICEVFPGPDNKVRVAMVKTQFGEMKRPISKLCPLPCNDELNN